MERHARYDELSRETNLDQLEGVPSERADVLMELVAEKFDADVTLFRVIRLRFSSITSSRSPAGVALAMLMLTSAAMIAAAVVGLVTKYAGAPGWLASTATLAVFTGVTTVGINLVQRSVIRVNPSEETTPAQPHRQVTSRQHQHRPSIQARTKRRRGKRHRGKKSPG